MISYLLSLLLGVSLAFAIPSVSIPIFIFANLILFIILERCLEQSKRLSIFFLIFIYILGFVFTSNIWAVQAFYYNLFPVYKKYAIIFMLGNLLLQSMIALIYSIFCGSVFWLRSLKLRVYGFILMFAFSAYFASDIFPKLPISLIGYALFGNGLSNQIIASFGVHFLNLICTFLSLLPILIYYKKINLKFLALGIIVFISLVSELKYFTKVIPFTQNKKIIVVSSRNDKPQGFFNVINNTKNLIHPLTKSGEEDIIIFPEASINAILNKKALFGISPFENKKNISVLKKLMDPEDILIMGAGYEVNNTMEFGAAIYNQNTYTALPKVNLFPFFEKTKLSDRSILFKKRKIYNKYFRDYNFLVLICYEGIFPLNNFLDNRQDIDFITVISSFYWVRSSVAYKLFIYCLRTRAMEWGVPLVLSENYDDSVIINSDGQIVKTLDDKHQYQVDSINLINLNKRTTLFSQFGNSIYLSTTILLLSILIYFNFRLKSSNKKRYLN